MIGKHIKKYREAKNETQESLAEKLNVTRQAISSWENEKTQPDIEMLNKIAEQLGVTVEELIYGAERKPTGATYNITNNKTITKGVTFGMVLAMILSYVKWQSIGWAILHGLLNWIYVIYYIIKYGWS